MTKRVYRQDRLQSDLMKPVKGPGGCLLLNGYAGRPGIMEYLNADGTVTRELVPLEALWHKDSIETLGRAPVTLEHPEDMVDPDNYQEHSVGDLDGDIVQGLGGYVRIKLAARRRDALEALESREKVELSPGYFAIIDETPGVHPEFGPYDTVQVAREYNHLAIVSEARGGSNVRLRMDGVQSKPITIKEDLLDPEKLKNDVEPPVPDPEEEPKQDPEEEPKQDPEEEPKGDVEPPAPDPEEDPKPDPMAAIMEAVALLKNFMSTQGEIKAQLAEFAGTAEKMDSVKARLDGLDKARVVTELRWDSADVQRIVDQRIALIDRAKAASVRVDSADSNAAVARKLCDAYSVDTEAITEDQAVIQFALTMPAQGFRKDGNPGTTELYTDHKSPYGPKSASK